MSLLAGYLSPFLCLHQLHPVRPPLHALPPANATQRNAHHQRGRRSRLAHGSNPRDGRPFFFGFDVDIGPGNPGPCYGMGMGDGMSTLRHGMERLPQGGFADARACAMAGEQIEVGYLQNVHRVCAHFSVGWKPAIWHLAFGILPRAVGADARSQGHDQKLESAGRTHLWPCPIPSESKTGSRTSSTCLAHHIPPMPSKSPTLLAIDPTSPTSGRREENGTSSIPHPPIPYTKCAHFLCKPPIAPRALNTGGDGMDVGGIGGRYGSLTPAHPAPPHRDAHADSFPPPHPNRLPGPLTDDGRNG